MNKKNILGLDLGTTSIGWALINTEDAEILGMGVRTFPEGINRDTKGAEISKNEDRRNARQTRRLFFRRRLRKNKVIRILRDLGLAPTDTNAFEEWKRSCPYTARYKSATEKADLYEIGRALFHIAQRRGFRSSRKGGTKEDSTIMKGNPQNLKTGIEETWHKVEQFGTLGKAMYDLLPKPGQPFELKERIRNRYTDRKMYINEFQTIWKIQQIHYPEILTPQIEELLGNKEKGILFSQRELRSQKFLIGKCYLEKNKTRCPVSSLVFERVRALQFINNIRYGVQQNKLNEEQRKSALQFFLKNNSAKKFDQLVRTLKLTNEQFNYDLETKLPLAETTASLMNLFTEKVWNVKTPKEQNDIWHIFFWAKDNWWLEKYATEKWDFSKEQIKKLGTVKIKTDYGSLSNKALTNILPFLEEGFLYHHAVVLGGVKNAFGEQWNNLTENEKSFLIHAILKKESDRKKEGQNIGDHQLIEETKLLLTQLYNLSEKQLTKLYHHSEQNYNDILKEFLPEPPQIRNPIAQKALCEVRKLMNEIIRTFGKPDIVKLELATELKKSKFEREEMRFQNYKNKNENDKAIKILLENGLADSRENRHRYLLWKELKTNEHGTPVCPYSGLSISLADLFDGNKFQIEHIIPRSRSLDDSFANKTLCEANLNREKGDKTPFEFFGSDLDNWKMMKKRAFKILPFNKARRFCEERQFTADDFIERQLNDTRIISKAAREFLLSVFRNVEVYPGRLTADLRHLWGLNNIINEKDDTKNRNDHRHHAIDALVIACTEVKFLQRLTKIYQKNNAIRAKEFPQPWEGFHENVKNIASNILVSCAQNRNLVTKASKIVRLNGKSIRVKSNAPRKQMHEETVYGRHIANDGNYYYHCNKNIDALTESMIEDIVDTNLKILIKNHLGYSPQQKVKNIPKNAFFDFDKTTQKKIPKLFLKNKRGNMVPIYSVRVKKVFNKAIQLKTGINQWVNPGANFITAIYKNNNILSGEVITFVEAVRRKIAGQEVAPKNSEKGNLILTLMINDMVLIGVNKNDLMNGEVDMQKISNNLYKVRKMSDTVIFTHHLISNINPDKQRTEIYPDGRRKVISISPSKMTDVVKVKIDLLGGISLIDL